MLAVSRKDWDCRLVLNVDFDPLITSRTNGDTVGVQVTCLRLLTQLSAG